MSMAAPSPSRLLQVLFMVACCCVQGLSNDYCPRLCECKWKSGKESVICLNANLSSIPLHLDAGTQVIDLTGNNIVTVTHDEFSSAGLLNLQKVYIAKCRLKTLDRYAFRHLINLVELDLSYNALSVVPSHAFDSIPELRELKLSGNPIQRIGNDAFMHVPQLVRLELSDCRIGTIETRGFTGLESSLEWLNVDGNRLVSVRAATFTTLHGLHGVELASNPWNCSCALRPLREWMLRRNVPYGAPPTCKTPARLAGRAWDKLELDEFACTPEISASTPKAHAVEGRNVTMSCKVGGVPEPNVRWTLRNRVIANLSSSTGRKLFVVHLDENSSNLTILTTDVADAGVYVCAAENKAGRAESSVTLAISRKQPNTSVGTRALLAGAAGVVLVTLSVCGLIVCVCRRRRRRGSRLGAAGRRREDSYEKIEMNHKVSTARNDACLGGSGLNGAGNVGENGIGPAGASEVAVLAPARRRGEYRGVPSAESEIEQDDEDDAGYEDDMEMTPTPTAVPANRIDAKQWAAKANENSAARSSLNGNHWNSDVYNSMDTDLHIPRRTNTYTDSRDDCLKPARLTSGIFNEFPRSASGSTLSTTHHYDKGNALGGGAAAIPQTSTTVATSGLPNVLHPHVMRKQVLENNAGSLYTTAPVQDDTLASNSGNYPDLLELSSYGRTTINSVCSAVADAARDSFDSEPDSLANRFGAKNKDNLYCTLPRKRGIYQSAGARFNHSTDSQSPLLADSRYSSSGGEDGGMDIRYGSSRRLSADQQYPLASISGRVGQRSNSFLNLTTERSVRNQSLPSSPLPDSASITTLRTPVSATPLLDITGLDTRTDNAYFSPTTMNNPVVSANANTYDYHAAQLERFLEEYRNLQDQLNKMKETCEGIRQQDTRPIHTGDPLTLGGSAATPDDGQPKSILKNKATTPTLTVSSVVGTESNLTTGEDRQGPYWLPRNTLLKRYNNGSTASGGYGYKS